MEVAAPKSYRHYSSSPSSAEIETGQDFADCVNLEKADQLLRSTKQYVKWQALRQNNAGLAADVADAVIRRHDLLERAQKGQAVNWKTFDHLTDALRQQGLFLFNSDKFSAVSPEMSSRPHRSPSRSSDMLPRPAAVSPMAKPVDKPEKRDIGKKAVSPFAPTEENLLVINATCDNYLLNNSLIGYGDDHHLFLPLEAITRTLDFSIQVENDSGKAKGWFISEDREFSLDPSAGTAIVDGKSMALSSDQVMTSPEGTLLVDSTLLSQWFPVDFHHDFANQSLDVIPRETLPFQARLERENNRGNAGHFLSNEPQYPRKASPYHLFEPPMVELGLSGSYSGREQNDDGFESDYFLLSRGDLGKMTTEVYVSGDDSEAVENTRVTLERNDPDGTLLGPLQATRITAGDIRTADFPVIGGAREKGLRIDNQDINRDVQFDTTHFEGNLPPGWDVEVYRNNIRIASQRVDQDGRYDFREIPLYYGKNEFELIFYGPQGQKRVETKNINIGSQMLKQGDGRYQVSLSQKDADLFENDDYTTEDENTLRWVSRYDYGLNDKLSLGGGIASEEVSGRRHDYLNFGFKGNVNGAYVTGDWVHDLDRGDALEGLVQTKAGPLDLRIRQQLFDQFMEDENASSSDEKQSVTDISASGNIRNIPFLPDMPYSLNYSNTMREESSAQSLGLRFSNYFKHMNLNSYIQWRDDSRDYNDNTTLEGYLRGTTQIGDFRIRGGVDYELAPDAQITGADLSSQYRISDRLNSELRLYADLEDDDDLSASLKFNWNNGRYTLSPQISYGSDDEFRAMMSLNTSFGREPRSGKLHFSSDKIADAGSVSARVFHDRNNNHVFDEPDTPIQGALVEATQSYRSASTDENGVAFITGLPKYRPTDVAVQKETLEDPFWEPYREGASIVPRPGHSEIMDIPVASTGEIDGTVMMKTGDGGQKTMNNVPVQLLNSAGEVVQEVRSEYDGFYLFMKVPPGDYAVRVDPENSRTPEKTLSPIDVAIDNDGGVVSGQDILLGQPAVQIAEATPVNASRTVVQTDQPDRKPSAIMELQKRLNQLLNDSPVQPVEKTDTSQQALRLNSGAPLPEAASISKPSSVQPESLSEPFPAQKYGLHLSSYRFPGKAVEGIRDLKEKFGGILKEADFTVKKVDLGSKKGTWYRVVAGAEGLEEAGERAETIKRMAPYCQVMPLEQERDIGIHLASFKTHAKAVRGLRRLQHQLGHLFENREFSIRRVDLGAEKGIWFRVIGGNFNDSEEAQSLKTTLGKRGQYAAVMDFSFQKGEV